MHITATARNLQLTDDIREYIEMKVSKFGRFLKQIDEVHVMLEEARHRYSLELTLHSRRSSFHAQATTGDIFASIDEALDKLEQQIRRHKERVSDRRHRAPRREIAVQVTAHEETIGDDIEDDELQATELEIQYSEEHRALKPMTIEEAAMQLSLSADEPFLAFRNAETGELNVVYELGDGIYRWIEPD